MGVHPATQWHAVPPQGSPMRLEHFLRPSNNSQWTLQAALSEPVPTTIDPVFRVTEDSEFAKAQLQSSLKDTA